MQRFWKIVAVFGVVGLFYVGYGLTGLSRGPAAPWESSAYGVIVDPRYSPFTDRSAPVAVTSSADGRTIYFWGNALKPKVLDPAADIEIQGEAHMPGERPGLPGLPPLDRPVQRQR